MARIDPYSGGTAVDPEAQQRQALLAQLRDNPYTDGATPVNAPVLQAPSGANSGEPSALPPPPSQQYGLEGFDAGKLASGHDSPKYQVGRVLQNYDPKAGLNQAGLMDALNALGIGQFSAHSDKLSVANGDPRFNGMSTWDSIRDQEGDAGWQFGVDSNMPGQESAGQNGIGALQSSSMIDGLDRGLPTDNDFFQKLLRQAKGITGPASTDRSALLSLLGQ